ncbi:L,D-transpeptidase [Cyanobium sp. PCC 7001]|uniref:L,D-transpeptidase n=1 Tax=Cyanobium sp. PCC 7001 TaxID=180281 RepID=UPI0012EAA75E|nr:L,D-transpeptidase [Cyanobium sp. PCC 7001]
MAQRLIQRPLNPAPRHRLRTGGFALGVGLAALVCSLPSALAATNPATSAATTPPAPLAEPAPLSSPRPAPLPGEPATQPAEVQPAPAAIRREIVLELGRREISLRENGLVVRRWPVAIGDPSTPTPVGTFRVENKVLNPRYQSTRSGKINSTVGPQGPLGDRWIGFKHSGTNQYGIHGTPTAWAWTVTSRAAVSNGCVRMLTPHVRELFDKVDIGTPVIVKR